MIVNRGIKKRNLSASWGELLFDVGKDVGGGLLNTVAGNFGLTLPSWVKSSYSAASPYFGQAMNVVRDQLTAKSRTNAGLDQNSIQQIMNNLNQQAPLTTPERKQGIQPQRKSSSDNTQLFMIGGIAVIAILAMKK